MERNDYTYLGKDKIGKILFKFALPCVLSLLISSLYNIVDQIFIGNSELGYLGNAATGLVFPVLVIAQAFAWCFGDGCAAYLSICQGKKDVKSAGKAIGSGISFTLISSIILLIILLLFKEPILYLFGASDKTIEMSKEYLLIIAIFLPTYMFGNMVNSSIRSDGSPGFAMIATASGAVANIILDPIFIYACHWGIAGAAYATVIGQVLTCILSIIYLFKSKTFRVTLKDLIPSFKNVKSAMVLGISTFITQIAIVVISLVGNISLSKYGALSKYGSDIPIAIMSIETKVFTIILNIIVGIILGAQPIVGYNIGSGQYDRVKKTYRLVIILTIIITTVFTIINEICPDIFIKPFGGSDNALYMEYGRYLYRIFLMTVIMCCFTKVTSIFFQSAGKPFHSMICSLIRDLVIFAPFMLIFGAIFESKEAGSGVMGLLYAAPLSDFITFPMSIILVTRFLKNLGKTKSKDQESLENEIDNNGIINSKPGPVIVISREHGSQGKYIGTLLAKKLGIPCYSKEIISMVSKETGLSEEYLNSDYINRNNLYVNANLHLDDLAFEAQTKIISKLASKGSCIIVGRASDYILKDDNNVIKIFCYADMEYKIKNIMEMYGDTYEEAKKNMIVSDEARKKYYESVTKEKWGDPHKYDICINTTNGVQASIAAIENFLESKGIKFK